MEYEDLTINHYWGNSFEGSRQAKLFADGRIEYEPDFDEDEVEPGDGEDEYE